jgi:hypothetical protein
VKLQIPQSVGKVAAIFAWPNFFWHLKSKRERERERERETGLKRSRGADENEKSWEKLEK